MSNIHGVGYIATGGVFTEFKSANGKPRVSTMPYTYDIAEGNIADHAPWSKIGFVTMPVTTETDVWTFGGTVPVIPLMATAATVKVRTAIAADAGTSIFAGTSDGGSTISLVDSTKNFNGGTAVAVGDCIILDKSGVSPEWGYVTAVTNNTTLAVAGGFSSGGTGSGRAYTIIDYSNQAGAHAVLINGLDGTYARQREIVVCGGAGPADVTTVKTWLRFNSFRVIAAGVNGRPTSYIAVMDSGAIPAITYTYITATYTRARNSGYTVPLGYTLYINGWNVGYSAAVANKQEYARIFMKLGQYSFESGDESFSTRMVPGVNIWYPYTEIVASNATAAIDFQQPIKVMATVDLKVTSTATAVGVVTSALRGWLEK